MLSLALPGRVFVCTLPTDMRKGFDSLAALVQTHLSANRFPAKSTSSAVDAAIESNVFGMTEPESACSASVWKAT